jgi:hypothetical protein
MENTGHIRYPFVWQPPPPATGASRGPLTSLLLLAPSLFIALYNIYLLSPTYYIPWNAPLLAPVAGGNGCQTKG